MIGRLVEKFWLPLLNQQSFEESKSISFFLKMGYDSNKFLYIPILINRNDGSLYKKLEFEKFEITVYQQMIIDDDKLYVIAANGGFLECVCHRWRCLLSLYFNFVVRSQIYGEDNYY